LKTAKNADFLTKFAFFESLVDQSPGKPGGLPRRGIRQKGYGFFIRAEGV
jgi:hypothetical protein